MKLTLILLVVFLQVQAKGVSQSKVTLNAKNASLDNILKEISRQTGLGFTYTTDISAAKKVDIFVKDAPVSDALNICFRNQPFTYDIVKNTIVIKAREAIAISAAGGNMLDEVRGKILNDKGDPVQGAAVYIKTTNRGTNTDDDGIFILKSVPEDAVLSISSVGYYDTTVRVDGRKALLVRVRVKLAELDQAVVSVSNGFQLIPKERATGSFGIINTELLNRKTSTNILDKLDGLTTGLYFYGVQGHSITTDPQSRALGVSIRGVSTLSTLVSKDPLIVLDNFPYDGDLNNINPNDIESITILKDAAAASIWGSKAGNGVIVLTTKKGKLNSKMKVEVNTNVTVINKPDLYKDPNFLDPSDYIDVEDSLFTKKYYNSFLNAKNKPALSPVIEILQKQATGVLSPSQAQAQIDQLRKLDVRRDFEKYVYQKAVNQQYSIGIRGGSENLTYALSVGYDHNNDNLIRNGYKRITINSTNTFQPIKNLEITTSLNYNNSTYLQNNSNGYGGIAVGGPIYGTLYPYAQLADANGAPLAVVRDYRSTYVDTIGNQGFQDWHFRPLDEIRLADNTAHIKDLLMRINANYKIASFASFNIAYEGETQNYQNRNYQSQQTYYARNLINQYSQIDPATHGITYNFPLGGILTLRDNDWYSYNWRAQGNFNHRFKNNTLNAIAGAEIRQQKTTGYNRISYGYDDQFGTSNNNLNYQTYYALNPAGGGFIPNPDGSMYGITYRYISYYTNASYTYHDIYTLSVSGRKDGANIFGVKANNRVRPLWSIGGLYDISKEAFYNLRFLPSLRIRATYGYSGNVYNGTAYVTGQYGSSDLTGLQYISAITPPNPDLRWERVRNINVGVDFGAVNNKLSGTIELYKKEGIDLIEEEPIAPSSGFLSFYGNAAATSTKGLEISLTYKVIDSKFKWATTLLFNGIKDKVTKYDVPQTPSSIQTSGGLVALKGKPLYSVFSYRFEGLDPQTGDPLGYLNKQISKDYNAIIGNYNPDSLVFSGSARPTMWGTWRNDFYYKGFSLSVMIGYKFGYYFRRSSITGNLLDIIKTYANSDYTKRWQHPGDEKITNVPSVIYPSNQSRAVFYEFSQALVQKGDNIRLQDIRLAYDLKPGTKRSPFTSLQIYSYLSNLGILWRANSYGIDPDANAFYGSHNLPAPFSIAFGINATF